MSTAYCVPNLATTRRRLVGRRDGLATNVVWWWRGRATGTPWTWYRVASTTDAIGCESTRIWSLAAWLVKNSGQRRLTVATTVTLWQCGTAPLFFLWNGCLCYDYVCDCVCAKCTYIYTSTPLTPTPPHPSFSLLPCPPQPSLGSHP